MSASHRRGDKSRSTEGVGPINDGDTQSSLWDADVGMCDGKPFSAMHKAVRPPDAQALIVDAHQRGFSYDEFGFRMEKDEGDSSMECAGKLPADSGEAGFVLDDSQSRLKWFAHLEFTHNRDVQQDFTWDKVDAMLPRSPQLQELVRSGIPHTIRRHVWPRLAGATLKTRCATVPYKELIKRCESKPEDPLTASRQNQWSKHIEKDLLRTLPSNVAFTNSRAPGVAPLRRLLRLIAFLYPDIGYCQGSGVVVATLLLVLDEETTFWMVTAIIEDLLPASYYSDSLMGLQAEQRVLRSLVASTLPETDRILRENDIELSLITVHWFLTLFAAVLPPKTLLRVWDMFFYEGSSVLFKVTLAMLKAREGELKCLAAGENPSGDIFNALSTLPSRCTDANCLLAICQKIADGESESGIPGLAEMRKKQTVQLMAEQGLADDTLSTTNDQAVNAAKVRRQVKASQAMHRSKSLVDQMFWWSSGDNKADDPRTNHLRRTELVLELRRAIGKIAQHFVSVEPEKKVSLQVDYSAESHLRDHEQYATSRRQGLKRARALLDFERRDEDELGFRKNDIITIICEKDEHCWVGEVNGCRGWFPAKFVQLLDERGQQYSAGGDAAVSSKVAQLVRTELAEKLQAVLEHGIRRASPLQSPVHPWMFVEELAKQEVRRDFYSVQSRLQLCKTFRLDEDGKVLTPEELLYRYVSRINCTHDANKARPEAKFRSLVCAGVNERCLHLWFELLCCGKWHDALRRRFYHDASFVRSPAWVQIKCELRVLSQFWFNLDIDQELHSTILYRDISKKAASRSLFNLSRKSSSGAKSGHILMNDGKCGGDSAFLAGGQQPLKDGVRDMLVKHHLFSWDL